MQVKTLFFHAPVKFEILGFLFFQSVFFRLVERKHPKDTSFIALYLFVSLDFNYNTYF